MHSLWFGSGLRENEHNQSETRQKHSRKHKLNVNPHWLPHMAAVIDWGGYEVHGKNVNARGVNSV